MEGATVDISWYCSHGVWDWHTCLWTHYVAGEGEGGERKMCDELVELANNPQGNAANNFICCIGLAHHFA